MISILGLLRLISRLAQFFCPSHRDVIGFSGTCLHGWQQDTDTKEVKLITFDYSPYSVKREKLGLNERYPAVEVDIMESQTDRMDLFFQQNSNVLACVRRLSTQSRKSWSKSSIDAEHIIYMEVMYSNSSGSTYITYPWHSMVRRANNLKCKYGRCDCVLEGSQALRESHSG
jgi:hypothetical protein